LMHEEHEEQKLPKIWSERIEKALKDERHEHKRITALRQYVSGRYSDDMRSQYAVRVNVVMATLQGLMPHVYAQAPDVAVTAVPGVTGTVDPMVKRFAGTLEGVLSRQLKDARLRKLGKRCVRAAMTTGLSWAKASYQRDIYRDPHIERRIQDAQEELRRLEHLMDECEDDTKEEHEAKMEMLRDLVRSLEEKVEVVRQEGLVLDYVRDEDIIVSPAVATLEDYIFAPWIAHRIWMTQDQAAETFDLDSDDLAKADKWRKPGDEDTDSTDRSQWVAVLEIWDSTFKTVYTLIQGMDKWARDPFSPTKTGERWYPFFLLAFNWVDGERRPISDVELWADLQDEYNDTRTKYREHRKKAVPARVGAAGSLSPEDARKLANPDLNEYVLADLQTGQRASDVVGIIPYPPVDPGLYDTSQIRSDLEMVSGLQDAARGTVARAKTATEAEILQMGLVSRTTERQASVEEWIEEMAQYCAEILLQNMTKEQVMRIVGPDAVWPELDKEDIFNMVNIEVRAGTTGRPDQRREQQTWMQLLPLIQQTIQQIAQAEAQGMESLANAGRYLLQETLRRFDETIDIDEVMPKQAAPMQLVEGVQ